MVRNVLGAKRPVSSIECIWLRVLCQSAFYHRSIDIAVSQRIYM